MPSWAAGISAVSSIAPSAVTPLTTKHDGAFKLFDVAGADGPFTMTTS
jgi:hypothetical protein